MKWFKFFFVCAVAMALLMPSYEELLDVDDDDQTDQKPTKQSYEFNVFPVNPRFLGRKKPRRRVMSCNKFPRVCGAKGSPGPHCCKKRCVNVLMNQNNCGMCGKKCKYNEVCCGGKCVNPSFNRRHCGGCNNRCKSGGFCAFGLCSYA